MTEELTLCTFRVGQWQCGLPITDVECALNHAALTAIPMAASHLAGLTNVHGVVATVIDLGILFDTDQAQKPDGHVVVLRGLSDPVGMQVDELGDVVQVEQSNEDVPGDVPERFHNCVAGIRVDDKGNVYCELSIDAVLDLAEEQVDSRAVT